MTDSFIMTSHFSSYAEDTSPYIYDMDCGEMIKMKEN